MKWWLAFLLVPPLAMAQQAPLPAGAKSPDELAQPAHPASGIAPELAAAEDKMEAHEYDAARPLLAAWLKDHPQDARALFDLGYVEDATGQQDAAERDYAKANTANPKQFESHAALGLLYAQTDRADQARTELEAASQLEPAAPDPAAKAQVWRSLAEVQLASDPASAHQSLLKALELTPNDHRPADMVLTGRIAEANHDPEDATVAYRQALTAEPGSPAATSGLVHLLLQEKKPQEAEPLLRSALAQHPEDVGLQAQLASVLAAQGNSAEALTTLEKLHQLQPANSSVTGMLADAYLQSGAPEKAVPVLAEAVRRDPSDASLLTVYGQSLIYTRQFAEAVPVLERATTANPRDTEAWGGLAFAQSQLHQDAAVLAALRGREQTAPDTPETLFLKATSYDNLHQSKQAAEYYERFLAAAGSRYPNEEWQAKHRLVTMGHGH